MPKSNLTNLRHASSPQETERSALVSSKEVESVVRALLQQEGYSITPDRQHGETGTDIIATKGHEVLHIEAIAYKKPEPARARDFYEVFFRAVSRLEHNATALVIALPSKFGTGLPQRAKRMGLA
jgi:Holliday junction resolvase-like predicted endonuclease